MNIGHGIGLLGVGIITLGMQGVRRFFDPHFQLFSQVVSGDRRTAVAVLHAVEETGWPILFTAITTIVALVSFYFVPISTIRWMELSSDAINYHDLSTGHDPETGTAQFWQGQNNTCYRIAVFLFFYCQHR